MQDTNLPPGVPAAGKPVDVPNQPQPAQNPAPQPAPADDPVLGNQPQPAAAPQPEPQVPAEPEQTDPAAGQITLQTGDAAVDAGLQMLAQVSGCTDADVERAMGNALRYGDASLIDEKFLQERLGNYAGYAKTLAETYLTNAASNTERTVNEVHTLAGGAEAWAQARDVFMANAPAHIQTAVKTMANSGLAKDAAQMVLDYARQSGALPVQGQHIHGMGGQAGNTALSAAEFSKELADLRTKFGNTSFESGPAGQAYQNLLERRARGKQLGR